MISEKQLDKFAQKAIKNKKTIIVSFIIIFSACFFLLFKLKFSANITDLLPVRVKSVKTLSSVLKTFGTLNYLFIDVYHKNKGPSELNDFSSKLTKLLKKGGNYKQVISGLSDNFKNSIMNIYLERFWYLIGKNDLSELKKKLVKPYIKKQLKTNFSKLLTLQSVFFKKIILDDPLNFREVMMKNFFSNAFPLKIKIIGSRFFSYDNKHTLIIAVPKSGMFNTGFSDKILKEIKASFNKVNHGQGFKLTTIGGHFYSLEHAKIIKRDITFTIVLTLIMIMGIFYFNFRKLSLAIITLIPLTGAMLFSTVICALVFGKINAMTLGFGGVILGMSIDYIMHFFMHFYDLHKSGENGDFAASSAAIHSGKSILIGAITTISAFAVIMSAGFSGLMQISLFCIAGLFFALVSTLTLIPALNRFYSKKITLKKEKSGNLTALLTDKLLKFYKPALFMVAAFSIFFIIMSVNLKFESNLKKLDKSTAFAEENTHNFERAYGEFKSPMVCFISSDNKGEKPLKLNYKLFLLLKKLQQRHDFTFFSVANMLPPKDIQRKNVKNILSLNIEKAYGFYKQEALKLGFSTSALKLFEQKIISYKNGDIAPVSLDLIGPGEIKDFFARNIQHTKNRTYIITSIYPGKNFTLNDFKSLRKSINKTLPEVYITGNMALMIDLVPFLKNNLMYLSLLSLAIIFIILYLYHRKLSLTLLNIMPVVLSILWSLGIMSALGIKINIINIIITALILGVGVDYGVYIIDTTLKSKQKNTIGVRAVVLSGLTTLAGFGTLIFAKYPSFYSIGLTVFSGILSVLIITVFLVYPICLIMAEKNRKVKT